MKKIFIIGLVVLVIGMISSFLIAEKDNETMMCEGMMGGKGMMSDQKQMMNMDDMHMMMPKYIVATSDGGVVVMIGNKLIKYDSNLDLKKEVEIKMDMESMKNMMEENGMMEKTKEKSKNK